MTSHCLRHFFISRAVEAGINFLVIAKWVGHSSTKMIEQVYAHLSPEFKNSKMEKFTPKRRFVCFGWLSLGLGNGNGNAEANAERSPMKKVDSGARLGIVCRLFSGVDRHDSVTDRFSGKSEEAKVEVASL